MLLLKRQRKKEHFIPITTLNTTNLEVRLNSSHTLSLPPQVRQKPQRREAGRQDGAERVQQEQDGGNSGHRRGDAEDEAGAGEVSGCVPIPVKSLSINQRCPGN